VARLLGADHYVSSVLSVEDGKYTGEIEYYAYGEFKAEAIYKLAEKYDYDLAKSYSYSDSISDAPMLDAVGYGTVVNPDKALRRLATEHGWNQLEFKDPVPLRAALASRASHVKDRIVKDNPKKSVAIAAGLAAAGVALHAARKAGTE
jgi:phosphoserine phosphatase